MTGIDAKDIVRHELIGLYVMVVESKDSSVIGIKGRVIDETRNTLVIEREDGSAKTLIKENCVFSFEYEKGKNIKIDGRLIVARPEDRIKKKMKKW